MKTISIVLALFVAMIVPAASAMADGPAITLDPVGTTPGGVITVNGSGFAASTATPIHVIAADGSELPVWTAVTDGNGAFSVQVMIPHTVLLGSYQVHAEGAPDAEATLKIADTSEGALANPTLAVDPVATVLGGVVTVTGTDLGTYLNVPIHLIDPAGAPS